MRIKPYVTASLLAVIAAARVAIADPGVTKTEIRIGSTQPYSGPASAYANVGHATKAYFDMVNDSGGVHGRKLVWMALDDAFTPSKTVEQTRKLVEREQVFMMHGQQGTAASSSVQKYLNSRKVPQVFVSSGSHLFREPKTAPWTIPALPSYYTESRIYARHILESNPNARIGLFYQNDDMGKDYVRGVKGRLGDLADKMIVAEAAYEVTDPTIDSQILALRAAGVDTVVMGSLSKQTSQALRKMADLGWKPKIYLSYISAGVSPTFTNAGLENAAGIISANVIKDPTDTRWQNDRDYQEWVAWMKKYYPDGDLTNIGNVYTYVMGNTLVHVLNRVGPELTRESFMKAMSSIDNYAAPMLVPGVTISTSPDNYNVYAKMQLQQFDGKKWVSLGEPIGE